MSPLNSIINYSGEISISHSYFKSTICSRVISVFGGVTCELFATVQNAINIPVTATLLSIKFFAKIINFSVGSHSLREFEINLPGLYDLIKTVLKTIGYAIGTLCTASLGLISPYANFRLHVAFGLVSDINVETALMQAERETAKIQEAKTRMMKAHVQHLIIKLRLNALEKERRIAEEAKKNSTTASAKGVKNSPTENSVKTNQPTESSQNLSNEQLFQNIIEQRALETLQQSKKI